MTLRVAATYIAKWLCLLSRAILLHFGETPTLHQKKIAGVEEVGDVQVRKALSAIVSSEAFSGARRLQEFLSYVVEEKLAGRHNGIKGKTIAADVYGRKIDGVQDSDKVVRVDASRLRRRLDQYYTGAGRGDAIRIAVPSGTYLPQFIAQAGSTNDTINSKSVARKQSTDASDPGAIGLLSNKLEMQRQAMFDKSPASLQAFNFAQQARGLIWPPSDPVRLKNALELFERAIQLDAKYIGGYAGASNVYAFMAFLSGSDDADQILAKASEMALIAQELNPTNVWVQSALAWISFVAKDFDRAKELSKRAIILDPADLYVLDFHGAMLLLNGDFEDAIQAVQPFVSMPNISSIYAHQNVYIIANFHLGRYREAIKYIIDLGKLGGNLSPLLVAYFAASQQAVGEDNKARKLVGQLKKSWSDFQPDKILYLIFRFPKHPQAVMELLLAAGWQPIQIKD